jgi:tetratricopeptide (TPR) repeat protein
MNMYKIKKIAAVMLLMTLIAACAPSAGPVKYSSGTFRPKWWNYYSRGLNNADVKNWQESISDLEKAVSSRPRDQRMARTYGMHFIDYFPHRELGIVYFRTDETDKAVRELEESISHEETAKAIFYLNEARRKNLLKQDLRPAPPLISVLSPAQGAPLNSFSVVVRGTVTGDGYVSKIFINNRPYRFDLAEKVMEFEDEISINEDTRGIVIVSEDLLGNVSEETISISVDREGPAINIFDIIREQVQGEEFVRVTGEVNDRTRIRELFFNGRNVVTNGSGTYEFDERIKRGQTAVIFKVRAIDSLNNETKARIDLEKELRALNEKPEPVLLAFNGSDIFSPDRKPPVIRLKDAEDIPAVFINRYYLEGEVSDNNRIEAILINGKKILSKKGRKIFFSKLLGLNEGSNKIIIEAFDSSGNSARSELNITRNIPLAMQVGSRMSVSILPFGMKDAEASRPGLAYEQLIGFFVEQKRFNILERTRLEEILLEQKLTGEKLVDPKYSIKVGRLMAADTILATSVNEGESSIEFIARVINTETSEIMAVRDVYSEDRSSASLKDLMDGLASKVAGSFPLVEGLVIKKGDQYIFIDIGRDTKIMRDMGVIVYRKGDEIIHPMTGRSLGWDTMDMGEGTIVEIHEDFSKAELSDKPRRRDVTVRDSVITK